MDHQKTHYDFLSVIGETHKTARNRAEVQWNKYYALGYERIVGQMLDGSNGTVLDVGTSFGHWFSFLKERGYARILGVEVDGGRAEEARHVGYTEVYNTDAAKLPLSDNVCDAAVSNDVFVHILRLEDKGAVLKEVERVLRPGGLFILNHTMSRPHGHVGYHIDKYCSFLDLDGWLRLIIQSTNFEIADLKPTYYNWRNSSPPLYVKVMRRLIKLPFADRLLSRWDRINAWRYPLDDADTVYIKLRKPLLTK